MRTGLHGYETAVRFLKDEPWPPDLLSRAALELFYAQSLVNYARMYSWEVSQRERVESTGKVDLKAWTREQIYDEAVRAYVALWKEREALGRESVKALAEFVEPNDYPPGIRPTLRDALSYFFTELLADSSGWSPAQSNGVFALDLAGLLRADAKSTRGGPPRRPGRPSRRPVRRRSRRTSRAGTRAAASARRPSRRGSSGCAACTRRSPRTTTATRSSRTSSARLPRWRDLPWFAMGQAQLAEFLESGTEGDALVRARAAAEAGRRAYPDSVGGQRCRAIVARIEAPGYDVYAMESDGAGRRSILVNHRNVGRLDFRAYALDLPRRLETIRDMNRLLPRGEDVQKILANEKPAAEWSVALPATPDYRQHKTYVVPPMKTKGLYVIAASGGFGREDFPVSAASFLVTDLVFTVSQQSTSPNGERGSYDVRVLSGETGRPVEGATVELLLGEWSPERIQRSASGTTDADGRVELAFAGEPHRGRRFFYARKGSDLALDLDAPYWSASSRPARNDRVARLHGSEHLPADAEDPLEGARVSRKRRRGAPLGLRGRPDDRDPLRPEQPVGRDRERDDQRLRHGRGGVRDPDRPRPRRVARDRPRSAERTPRCASRSTSARPSRSSWRIRRSRSASIGRRGSRARPATTSGCPSPPGTCAGA